MQPIKATPTLDQATINTNLDLVLTGNVSPGNGLTFDSGGAPLTYSPDNTVGCIIRVGSLANSNALPNHWAGNNVDTIITHNLNRVPTGFIVIAKWGSMDIYYGSVAATKTTITLKTTYSGVDSTIWILC
jgi:hypothetical protein